MNLWLPLPWKDAIFFPNSSINLGKTNSLSVPTKSNTMKQSSLVCCAQILAGCLAAGGWRLELELERRS